MSPTAPLAAPAPAARLRRFAAASARIAGGFAALLFGLLLLTWLSLHWLILPHIERWRPWLETEASQALGVPVRIAHIEARSSGWVPSVELHDVTLLDANLRPALQLSRVVASVSARSMLASMARFELRLAQLLIDGAQLEVRRDAAGRLFVAGFDFSQPDAGADTGAADWFFKQREIAIRGATLRWTDEQRGAPPLELSAVDLVLRNTLRGHALRLDGTPPPGWGERFSVRGRFSQPLLARSSEWQHWSGEVYVDAPRADASQLRRYLDLPFELSQGVGTVRAWVGLRDGVANSITLDLALRAVALQLGADLEPLVVEQLQGRLTGERRAGGGGTLALRQFQFRTGDGVHWPAGDLAFSWTRGAEGALLSGELSADRLDLAVVAQTAGRLPIGAPLRKLLAEANPRGIAHDVAARWDGPLDALVHYRVKARLDGMSLDARAAAGANTVGRPGLRNAAIDLDATERGGDAKLTMRDGAVELPGLFAEPVVPLDELQATLRWQIEPREPREGADPAIRLQVLNAKLANADAAAELNGSWATGPGQGLARAGRLPGVLTLDGTVSRGIATRMARYLPLGLPEGTRRYVERALVGGVFSQVAFHIKGDLWDFPFYAGRPGEFRVKIVGEDLTLAYVPSIPDRGSGVGAAGPQEAPYVSPWPPMTRVSGELVVDRAALSFSKVRAQIYGVALSGLEGGIANLAEKPVLQLATDARGPLPDMLRFINTTPVGDWTHGALREATAGGNGDLKVSLTLPLHNLTQTRASGSLLLAGNDVRLRRELPLLTLAHGRADFTNNSLTLADAGARVLGGEVTIDGGTQPDGSLRFTAQGRASAEALRRTPELGPLARLAGAMTGQTNYRLALGVGRGPPEIDLTSDLVGLGIELPPPLRKAADTALPLHYRTAAAASPPGSLHDTLQVELGTLLRAQYVRDMTTEAPRVLRGGIGVFEPAPTPADGVSAAVNVTSLDIDAWEAATNRLFAAPAAAATPASAASVASAASALTAPERRDSTGRSAYAPTQVGLKAQELTLFGRKLSRVAAAVSLQEGEWRATVDADQLAGTVAYIASAPRADAAPTGSVHARLTRLKLPKGDADEVTNLLDRQPASVPALDIVIDELELRGRRLGRLEVLAVNRLAPVREWALTRLNLSLPEAQLRASGRWAATPDATGPRADAAARRRAELTFQLDIADSGALLQRMGMAEALRGGKGQMKGDIAWLGSPLTLDVPSLSGQFNIAIEQGQFLQVSPGAARLLGVLSMQSLARRLTGDFRDLFQEGFVFDSITGDAAVGGGAATTKNLLMRGPQAAVLMEGRADIARETQDLRVVVVPEINAGAVSLAYAVINPVIGLGSFLAQLFLREPLVAAGTREFRVSGPWADPQVEPVERLPGQAAPRIELPAAAVSAAAAAGASTALAATAAASSASSSPAR